MTADAPAEPDHGQCAATHLRWGYWALALFAIGGVALETLHAYKWPGLLDPGAETRRLMWRLAHAHGALLGLINVVYGLSAPRLTGARGPGGPGRLLRGATVLLPAGFLLGGIGTYGGDPGVGVALAPIGGLLLVAALIGAARAAPR